MKKVLFVVTSHSQLGDTGKDTGAYIGEITHPYHVLTEAGYEVDFISPKGGKTPLDGMDKIDEVTKKLLDSPSFMEKLNNTKKPSEVDIKDYAAIFYAGGHGTMYDLPENKKLQEMTATMYENQGVVAAVCHGPAGLLNVQLSNGNYLVKGKKLTAFTNEEEKAVELTKVMPFLLETKLKERGAEFKGADNFEENVIVSDRLVTGQNPASAKKVGEEILKLIK